MNAIWPECYRVVGSSQYLPSGAPDLLQATKGLRELAGSLPSILGHLFREHGEVHLAVIAFERPEAPAVIPDDSMRVGTNDALRATVPCT